MPKTKMTSLLRRVTDRFTPNASSTDLRKTAPGPDGFLTAKGTDALFPRTDPAVDGEDCLHDCENCSVSLPRGFKIDEEDKLFGHINGWSRHLIVATGKNDWVRDVTEEKGSVMEAVEKFGGMVEGGKLMLSASNMNLPDLNSGPYGPDRPTTVLLMPGFQFVDGVTPKQVPELIRSVINTASTNTSSLPSSIKQANGILTPDANHDQQRYTSRPTINTSALPSGITLRNCPHKYVILMCSQATRDARCGQSAPLLKRELERHLRPLGLYRDADDDRPGGVGLYFISHVGGHKYSANMLIYRREEPGRSGREQMMVNGAAGGTGDGGLVGGKAKDVVEREAAQCIWLARVRPEDCENIVRFTVLQGKVVKPERQLRGGFDRERGVVSW